jgi:hypothetical protein
MPVAPAPASELDEPHAIQKNGAMLPRYAILLTAIAALGLNGLAPLATGADWRDGSHDDAPCQVMPATAPIVGAAIGVKSLDLTTAKTLVVEMAPQPAGLLPEPMAALTAQRTLLAQHILLRI